ncbi:MAG: ABC transporter ATP-binding protein, partial [Rhodothermales bacterium]
MPANAVEIRRLGHSYGDRVALRDLDFIVPSGILFGLLGPNGGGKTTLIRILGTLLRPSAGSASVEGFDTVKEALEVRKRLGIVFQDVALDDELSVKENLHAHASLYDLDARQVRARLEYLLPALGLAGRENERVDRLSGGLKRRADLVRGLLHSPRILLLDEPTTGLDPAARHAFWDAVDHIRRREEITLVVATHIMEEAERCDLLAIIDTGRMVASGSPDELKSTLGSETLWIEATD